MGGRDGSRLVYESPLVVRVLEARVEPVARALAGLEEGEPWPSNEALGGGPTGTRDDEYRAAMLDQAREILFADMGERFDPSTLGEPDILGVAVGELWQANGSDRRMDATPPPPRGPLPVGDARHPPGGTAEHPGQAGEPRREVADHRRVCEGSGRSGGHAGPRALSCGWGGGGEGLPSPPLRSI